MANTVLKTANSRVFLLEGGAGPTRAPAYQSMFRMTAVSQGFGDISSVEAPDPYNYGQFVQIAQIQGASARATTTLEGRYYMDLLSTMLRLARQGCSFDVQLHLGACGDPSDFNTFTKGIVLEDVMVTNYKTDDLGALQSDANAVVNETIDISAADIYEIRPLTFATKADTAITNEIIDLTLSDAKGCAGGDCGDASDGCTHVYAVSTSAGGSPSTPADVVHIYGTTSVARDIDTLGATNAPTAIAGVGSYIVVASTADHAYHYALKSKFVPTQVPTWTKVVTTGGDPVDIFSLGNVAYMTGTNGYVWKMTNPGGTLTTLTAGTLTTTKLNDVHALDADYAVVVGELGLVMYTTNGSSFTVVNAPALVSLKCVWMMDKTTWFVGTGTGQLYYTTDTGATWTLKSFPGSGSGSVTDIDFSTGVVGYMTHTNTTPTGRILRTYDGGYTWNVMPEGTAIMPTNQRFNKVAVCSNDCNVVYAGGLGVATDGIVVAGTAS
jgi:hypothetical protein